MFNEWAIFAILTGVLLWVLHPILRMAIANAAIDNPNGILLVGDHDMVKRVAVMFATILIALGVGIGAGLLPANPRKLKSHWPRLAVWCVWGLVKVLSRNGDIWKFRAPYP